MENVTEPERYTETVWKGRCEGLVYTIRDCGGAFLLHCDHAEHHTAHESLTDCLDYLRRAERPHYHVYAAAETPGRGIRAFMARGPRFATRQAANQWAKRRYTDPRDFHVYICHGDPHRCPRKSGKNLDHTGLTDSPRKS